MTEIFPIGTKFKTSGKNSRLCIYLRDLSEHYDHLTSHEVIIDTIKANEYTFTESGKLENGGGFPDQFIAHPFFPFGAMLFNVKNAMCFVYLNEDENPDGNMCAWYTGVSMPESLDTFLNECAEDKHSALGYGQAGTYAEVMKDLFNAK